MNLVKNIKKNTFVLLLLTSLVLVLILKNNYKEIIKALSSIDYKYIIIAIIFFFLYIFFKSLSSYSIVNNPKKIPLREAFKHDLILQFFNGVTPFSTGGQPMEIYMLTEHNIKAIEATNISLQNFIFYQTALIIYGLVAVACNYSLNLFASSKILSKLVLLGFFINALVGLGLLLIIVSKNFTKKISTIIINFLSKIKIIKNKEKSKEIVYNRLDEFHEVTKLIDGRKGLFIKCVFFHLCSLTFLYTIPLFVVYSLHDYTSLNLISTITSSAYVLLIGSFVPIPGASGGIEYGFLKFFGNFIGTSLLSAALIVWRFITYYFAMIIGALVFSLEKKVK